MGEIDPGSAREEAERLVATALAAARLAGSDGGAGLLGAFGPVGDLISGALGHAGRPGSAGESTRAGGRFATGSAECCVCPICRTMTALRDPSPDFAERLATGAGDFAAGVASLLRALSTASATPGGTTSGAGPSDSAAAEPTAADPAGSATDGDQVWRRATRTGHDLPPTAERDVWAAATRTDDPAGPGWASRPTGTSRPATAGPGDGGPTTPKDGGRATVPASRTPGESLAAGDEGSADEG
jgi:hypothetical protein